MKRLALVILTVVFLCPAAWGYSLVFDEYYHSSEEDPVYWVEFINIITWDPYSQSYAYDTPADSGGFGTVAAKVQADEGDMLDVAVTLSITWSVANEMLTGNDPTYNMAFDYNYNSDAYNPVTTTLTVDLDSWAYESYSDALPSLLPQLSILDQPAVVDPTMYGEIWTEERLSVYADVEIVSVTPQPIPEPATTILLGVGIFGLLGSRKFSKR